MSLDLQVVFPQRSVLLSNISPVPGTGSKGVPRALDIKGVDFNSVDEVLMNSLESPDVVIMSKTRLIAQVPDALQSETISNVSVISRSLSFSNQSLLRFRIGDVPGRVSGIMRLVQLYLKILFTTPGKDIFTPRLGGGALKAIGATFGANDGGNILSNFIIAVDTTSRQIVAIQSRNSSIPRDERLLSAKVRQAGFDRNEGAINVSIELTSQAGRSALANLEL